MEGHECLYEEALQSSERISMSGQQFRNSGSCRVKHLNQEGHVVLGKSHLDDSRSSSGGSDVLLLNNFEFYP